ncbi:MAG: alpha-glucosidase/alpha-galactosidase [Phycisphaerae bacterium]|nr:alpha-glucosidase/alpha-galactosidase [Phycisphaerae bacterium]
MVKHKKKVKVVVIGAGSASFGRGVLADLFGQPAMSKLDLRVVLVDIDRVALDRMARLAELIREHYGSKAVIESTTQRTKALKGADYVIISVSVKRMELWEQDFRVPLAYGFKHPLGENGGPGAMFHTLRSLELVLPICRDVVRICPRAHVLNFTNPESRVLLGITLLTKARAVGLCHGQMSARNRIAEILERPLSSVDAVAGGINHFFWFTRIADAKTGKDLYPLLRKRIARKPSLVPPLVRKMVDIFGCFTYPSDDHIGEYLAFAHEFTGLKWHYGRECHRAGHKTVPWDWTDELTAYIEGRKRPDDALVTTTEELAVPIIAAISLNKRTWLPAVNVVNAGGLVENLQRHAIVEVPAVADGRGIRPQGIGSIPEALAAFCRTQASIQKLIIEAYRARSRNLLLQALLLEPVVDRVDSAERLLDDMLNLQKEYLPKFA